MSARKKTAAVIERVRDFILNRHLVKPGQNIVVGVSGGPDSVCLLHVLYGLRQELAINLHIAHMNHQLRGDESDEDALYVADLAVEMRLPATITARDVEGYAAEHRLSLEEAAREVRYAFLAEVAHQTGAVVAVGHTRDDNCETILMHLIRGAGMRGLRGLQPLTTLKFQQQAVTVIRPLLEVTREETLAYTTANCLQPRFDATNQSLTPLRNKIRQQLIPLLKTYNPQIIEALTRTASQVGEDYAFMEGQAAEAWNSIASITKQGIMLHKTGLLKTPVALQKHLLRMAAEKLLGDMRDIEAGHIEQAITALEKSSGKTTELPHGLKLVTRYDSFLLTARTSSKSNTSLEQEYAVKVPGKTVVPGWKIATKLVPAGDLPKPENDLTVYLDFAVTGDKITVDNMKTGDRFQPLGLGAEKKLGRFLIDARIPRAERCGIPVVRNGSQILWVVGHRIDERVKVTVKTPQILKMVFQPV